MAKKTQETAEQKLLKMIETSSGAGDPSSVSSKKVAKKQNFLGLIKIANRLLSVCIIVFVIGAGIEINDAINAKNSLPKINVGKVIISKALGAEDLIPPTKNLSGYLSALKRRNLFSPYEKKTVSSVAQNSKANSKIENITAKYRLVGISWLDDIDSASVMLEDTEKEVTHFLQKGEKLGDILVKTIYADSVELGYENEEIIIRYDKSQM